MPVLADFHMHSCHSGDSETPMEEMIQKGISLGFSHLCFTEHMDIDFGNSPRLPGDTFLLDIDRYHRDYLFCREKYRSETDVKFGIELGVQPHLKDVNTGIARGYDFDFIIASCHTVKKQDPIYSLKSGLVDDETMYNDYFGDLLCCVKNFDEFDVLGHVDYIIRYGKNSDMLYSYEKYAHFYDEMIDVIIEKGKGIELNTAAVRAGLKELHPCCDFLREYKRRGGEIVTVGSDAHKACDIGSDFKRAGEVLKECGFEYYCTFDKRRPVFHKI